MKNYCKDYSQWFPGEENDLTDLLSQDFHLSDKKNYLLFQPNYWTDSIQLKDLTASSKNNFFSLLNAAVLAWQDAATRKTHNQQSHSWNRWTQFQQWFNLDSDPFLNKFTQCQKTIILSAFAQQIQDWKFNAKPKKTLASKTVETTMDYVTIKMTHKKTDQESLAAFYNNSTRATKTWIQERNTKKQSLSASSGVSTNCTHQTQ